MDALQKAVHQAGPRAPGQPPLGPAQVAFSEEQLNEEVWLNLVGTFGIGSAGYWWGRAGAALVRLTHYLTPRQLQMWLLLCADDGLATAGGQWFQRPLLFHLYLLMVLEWPKVRGGLQLEWVGHWLDFARFEIGVSAKRAA